MSAHTGCAARRELRAEELLKKSALKVTDIRVGLLTLLHEGQHPQSAEDLYSRMPTALKKLGSRKSADLVTVYRNLKSFLEAGLVQSTELGTGRKLYEWLDQSHHHHHVICRMCGRVDTLEVCGLDQHFKDIRKMGYADLTHRLEFFGVCASCQNSQVRDAMGSARLMDIPTLPARSPLR